MEATPAVVTLRFNQFLPYWAVLQTALRQTLRSWVYRRWVIVSWGVVIGAMTSSTVLGITVFWMILYGAGFLLSLLPEPWPSPDRELARIKFVLRGQFNEALLLNLVLGSVLLSALAAAVGL